MSSSILLPDQDPQHCTGCSSAVRTLGKYCGQGERHEEADVRQAGDGYHHNTDWENGERHSKQHANEGRSRLSFHARQGVTGTCPDLAGGKKRSAAIERSPRAHALT
ncbi:hypothetical protein San01_48140 [Streptomyces angustmyceticus]|uniref:Uncharacterized protein n=1 Tax=Streptomyces angustmyceticus TaxID=285578 RepID=A0A5J4LDS1_9ACTN|nr:hypothetical protein San01_48140 [Streptomyces angustmyceticus]